MRDPYFGHRDWFTGEELEDREAWTDWDYALMSAYQIIQDNTDSDGVLSWENESDRIEVNADRKISKFHSSQQRKTSGKKYKPQPGERFVPDVKLLHGEWPTFSEYVEKLIENDQ